jgi:ketosteroid isomerase-like protein
VQRRVVDAFFAAARKGDFDALVAVLDPDVVARTDGGPKFTFTARGAAAVAGQALTYARPAATLQPALVNGAAGVVVVMNGRVLAVMGFTVVGERIVEIDSLTERARLDQLDLEGFVVG